MSVEQSINVSGWREQGDDQGSDTAERDYSMEHCDGSRGAATSRADARGRHSGGSADSRRTGQDRRRDVAGGRADHLPQLGRNRLAGTAQEGLPDPQAMVVRQRHQPRSGATIRRRQPFAAEQQLARRHRLLGYYCCQNLEPR